MRAPAHKLYGTLPWKELVMPVAELAKQFQVSRELARRMRIFGYVSALCTYASQSLRARDRRKPAWAGRRSRR